MKEKEIIIYNDDKISSVEYKYCKKHDKKYIRSQLDPKKNQWVSINPQCPECFKYAQEKNLLGRSIIPARFLHCNFDNYITKTPDQKNVLAHCLRYALSFPQAKDNGRCLILSGNPGTGKNHLASAICSEVIEQGYKVGIVTVMQLIRRIRDTWQGTSVESESEIINKFAELDLLVIDEVGRQNNTENEKNIIFEVIDSRYSLLNPTIVISNYSGGFTQFLGEAACDRLLDRGGKELFFTWGSFRVSDPSINPHIKD